MNADRLADAIARDERTARGVERFNAGAGIVDRFCGQCGADLVGNDPHAPGCPEDAS